MFEHFPRSDSLHSFFKRKFDTSTFGINLFEEVYRAPRCILELRTICVTYMSVRVCSQYGKGEFLVLPLELMFTNKVIFDKAVAWGVKGSDIHYSQKFNISSLLGNIVSLFFELFDEVLVDCTNGHAEISKTKIESKKKTQKTKGRKQKKAKKSATGVFLFFVSSDQEKFCRWQKIRFHGQVAEIAIFTSQSSTRRSNAEI